MSESVYLSAKLKKGEVDIYKIGEYHLHAYKTNDPINDEVFILEKNGNGIVIESPCFTDNIQEFTEYIDENSISVDGVVLSYHMAGASFLPDAPKYATVESNLYGHAGEGYALIENFTHLFGNAFDNSIHIITNFMGEDEMTIGGIGLSLRRNKDAFDIVFPQIESIYTHMLGHNSHSILTSITEIALRIDELNGYIPSGYRFILSSHDTPENLDDVKTKIGYLVKLKEIAEYSKSQNEFISKVTESYPDYSGTNYLEMTAKFLFPE